MQSVTFPLFSGKTPDAWRIATIHSIPKEQMNTVDPAIFRGLALQSCMYKILSDVINVRIAKFLEKGEIVDNEQNSF